MKRFLILILAATFAFGMVGCGQKDKTDEAASLDKGGYTMNPDLIAQNTEGKTKLTLACFVLMPDIEQRIIDFNNTNSEYYIEVLDYSQYNTPDDYSAGETKLNTEILGGNTPDLIELGKMPIETYTNKGLLEDLNNFLSTDVDYSIQSIVPGAYQALSTGNALYRITPSFTAIGLYGKSSMIGDAKSWNATEMKDILDKNADIPTPFINMPTGQLFSSLNMYTLNTFIDRSSGISEFNSPQFAAILEIVKQYGGQPEGEYVESIEALMENKALLATSYMGGINQYAEMEEEFAKDINFIGFPTNSGNGNVADFQFSFGMFSDSENKEGCWQFLRSFLDKEYQKKVAEYEIPVEQSVFTETLKASTATEEQKRKYSEFINSITRSSFFDDTLIKMIEEESMQYIEDKRSLDETINAIQSRVSIYLSENK